MRIERRAQQSGQEVDVLGEIRRAKTLGPLPEPVCRKNCPLYKHSTGCHMDCPSAPCQLSSDKDRYPLEPMVTPLVFELKKLGVFHPCWSCEGHSCTFGSVYKIPRVWFYADSVVHLRALSDATAHMFCEKRLNACWHITVTFSDRDNPDTAFSLEPVAAHDCSLHKLQVDLRTMATNLAATFWKECDRLEAWAAQYSRSVGCARPASARLQGQGLRHQHARLAPSEPPARRSPKRGNKLALLN